MSGFGESMAEIAKRVLGGDPGKKRKLITQGGSSFQTEEMTPAKPGPQRTVSAESVPFKSMKRIFGGFNYDVRAYAYRSYDNSDARMLPIKGPESHFSEKSRTDELRATLTFSLPENQKYDIPLVNPENKSLMPLMVCVEGISKVTDKRVILAHFSVPQMTSLSESINSNRDQLVEITDWDFSSDFKATTYFIIERKRVARKRMENGKETKQEQEQETKQVDSGDEKEEEEEGEVPRREAVPKNVPRVKSDEEEEIVTVHFHTLRITFNMEHIWDFLGDPDSTESNGMTI